MQRRIAGSKDPFPYEHNIDCHYIGCIDRTYHTLERLVECVTLSGRPVLDAIRCWNGHVYEKYQVPLAAFQEPAVPIELSAAPHTEPDVPHAPQPPDQTVEPIDYNAKSDAFRNSFILRHGRDMRVLMSSQQAREEHPVVSFPYDYDTRENYGPQGKMAYIRKIRQGQFAETCYENGMVMVGNYHRYQSCMHMIPDGCIQHEDGTRVLKYRPMNCGRVMCLECLLSACNKTAGRGLARLSAMMLGLRAGLGFPSRKYIFIHGVYSLSLKHNEDFKTEAGRKRIYARFLREIKRLGFVGGLYVTHPWRFDDDLLKNHWSVHIHFIAAGYVDDLKWALKNTKAIMSGKKADNPVTDLNNRTGDTYRYIRSFSSFERSFDTIAYLVSHAGVEEKGGQVVKYFGVAAPNKFGTSEIASNEKSVLWDMDAYLRSLLAVTIRKKQGRLESAKSAVFYIQSDYMDIDLHKVKPSEKKDLTRTELMDLLRGVHGVAKLFSMQEDYPATAISTGEEEAATGRPRRHCDCGNRNCDVPPEKQVCDCGEDECKCFDDGSIPFARPRRNVTMNVFVVLRLCYSINDKLGMPDTGYGPEIVDPTGPGPPEAVEVAYKDVVIHLDPGMERLCPKCMSRKATVLPINGIMPQPYDPEHHNVHRCYRDAENWENWSPTEHHYKGRPYCKGLNDMLHWDNGLGLPNRYYDRQPRRVRDNQDLAILETFVSFAAKGACELLHGMDEYARVREMKPYARLYLHENGLPEPGDKYWDLNMFEGVVDRWHQGGIQSGPVDQNA